MCSPETIESLFIAYRLTGDDRYREYGWKIFQSIEKHCRLESGGYVSILNVDDVDSEKIDKMETFFLVWFLFYRLSHVKVYLLCFFFLERDFEVSLLALLWSKRFAIGQYVFSRCLYPAFQPWHISNFNKNMFSIQRCVPFLPHSMTLFFITDYIQIQRDIHSLYSNPLSRQTFSKASLGSIYLYYRAVIFICIIFMNWMELKPTASSVDKIFD